jgi:hypothetical protein
MILKVYINYRISCCEFKKLKTPVLGGAYNIAYICVANYFPPSHSVEKLVIAARLRDTEKR